MTTFRVVGYGVCNTLLKIPMKTRAPLEGHRPFLGRGANEQVVSHIGGDDDFRSFDTLVIQFQPCPRPVLLRGPRRRRNSNEPSYSFGINLIKLNFAAASMNLIMRQRMNYINEQHRSKRGE